jgi:hypothetical protein
MSTRIAGAVTVLRSSTSRGRSRRHRAALPSLALAGVVGLSLFASACGSSTGTGVAQVDSTQTATSGSDSSGSGSPNDKRGALVAFAACMRKHGLPNFLDPKAVGDGYRLTFGTENGIDVSSPQFKNAQQACKKLLPNKPVNGQEQAKQLQEALKYAACIRSHGVPNFPDPKVSSDGGIETGPGPNSSIDPESPQAKAADKACRQLLPGAGGGTSTTGSGEAGSGTSTNRSGQAP